MNYYLIKKIICRDLRLSKSGHLNHFFLNSLADKASYLSILIIEN